MATDVRCLRLDFPKTLTIRYWRDAAPGRCSPFGWSRSPRASPVGDLVGDRAGRRVSDREYLWWAPAVLAAVLGWGSIVLLRRR